MATTKPRTLFLLLEFVLRRVVNTTYDEYTKQFENIYQQAASEVSTGKQTKIFRTEADRRFKIARESVTTNL